MKTSAPTLPVCSLVILVFVAVLICVSEALSPALAQCVPAPSGLVSWWRGENNTTDDWDSNEGPVVSLFPPGPATVTFGTGKVGNAFASSFTVEDSASLRVSDRFTIEAWVYLAVNFDTTNRTIFS